MNLEHVTLPREYREQIQAVDPDLDLVALKDEEGRDWIWYEGTAFYVGSLHLPGAQWVVDYRHRSMCMGSGVAIRELEDRVARHQDYPHPATR